MPPKRAQAKTNNNGGPPAKKPMQQTKLTPSIGGNWEVTDSLLIYTPPDAKPSSKILGLDMDGTIITTKSGKVFAQDTNDWKLLNDQVISKLKQYQSKGFKIVIMSNQSGIDKGHVTVAAFQTKVENILQQLGLPIQGYFSVKSDRNRKPMIGMWEVLEKEGNGGVAVDRSQSIYCGDAAGRPAEGSRKKDFSCGDRLFALNLGVPFRTPEQLWLERADAGPYSLPNFDPKAALNAKQPQLPTLTPPKKQEVILMVGYPASGKSYFCKTKLAPLGYTIVSRDVLNTWQKCVNATKDALRKGESVAVDNTNMDAESRGRYVEAAKAAGCPIRCFVMKTTVENARHNERFRVLTHEDHEPISQMVFNMLKSKYQEPTMKEGFSEIVEIPFVVDKQCQDLSLYCMHLLEK
ncbi:unnamed protein product [Calicophoron daubneyi]|uniref:Bifunctional polynucleotide phosphatase/kinase n=1 Tax=Calicophoron daubneyi TaxID=300641 RepID=A0AAV2T7T6_CALDB